MAPPERINSTLMDGNVAEILSDGMSPDLMRVSSKK